MKAHTLPVDDRVDRDGEAVVLLGSEVVRLSALATTLLDACVDGRDVAELTELLVREFGEPPAETSARELTERALAELQDQGLVACE